MRTTRQAAADQEQLLAYAARLYSAFNDVDTAQSRALDYATTAGELAVEIKRYLSTSPSLLTFQAYIKKFCPRLSIRSLSRYEQVYLHRKQNSQVVYSSIAGCLRDWRKDHPKKPRFTPIKREESKEVIAGVPLIDTCEFIKKVEESNQIPSIPMLEWTAPLPVTFNVIVGKCRDIINDIGRIELFSKEECGELMDLIYEVKVQLLQRTPGTYEQLQLGKKGKK